MAGQPGFFDLSDRYEASSAAGDPSARVGSVVDFEVFRGPLIAALRRSVRGKGGRPPFDPVSMFKMLVSQIEAGGVKSHHLHVGDARAGAPGHGDAVAGRAARGGGESIDAAGAAGGEDRGARGVRFHRAAGLV
ncbi:hypothetical protein OY671_009508, partial [Metschnikowia pulcherrima]